MDAMFNLTEEEKKLTAKLQQKICTEIMHGESGVPFRRYMELALYDPEGGYYNNLLHKFGAKGDFITSPSLSNLFAHTISLQLKELFLYIPEKNILEFGGGNGDLLLGVLEKIGEIINKYYVLELSANAVEYQKQQLCQKFPHYIDKVVWLNELPGDFIGIMLGNEVLDAQPCEVFALKNDGIYLKHVDFVNDRFVYRDVVMTENAINELARDMILEITQSITEKPYISEVNLNNRGFMKSLAESLKIGAILLIDYGYGSREYYAPHRKCGTLRGFYRHQLVENVLQYPGLIDITASVDFSSVAISAIDNGLELIGYTTQANFLLNCGIANLHLEQAGKMAEADFVVRSNHLNKLTSPNYMGDVFKAIGFSKGLDFDSWCGFMTNDRTYTL